MTLTGIGGSLGIGLTIPSKKLDVFGSANISGALDVGGAVDVGGNLTVAGTFNSNINGPSYRKRNWSINWINFMLPLVYLHSIINFLWNWYWSY